jgi:hypothetical protein
MTTTNMARLNDMVRMTCGGALDGVVRMEMFNTLKEWFQRTDSWLLEVPIYIQSNTNDYQVNTGQNVVVNRLMGLDRPSSPPPSGEFLVPPYLPMCPPQYLTTLGANVDSEVQDPLTRTQRVGVLLNAGAKCPILRIRDNPSADEVWIATLCLNICDPVDSAGFTSPPDWVMEKYLNYLANGVNMRLMLQPGKPYSSLPGAQYHGRMFNQGIGLCRTEVRRMFTYGSQRWNFPGGWNSWAGLFAIGAR